MFFYLGLLAAAAATSHDIQAISVDGQSIQLQASSEGDARRTSAASRGHQHAEAVEHKERAREFPQLREELEAVHERAVPPSPEPLPMEYTPTHKVKSELFETCSARAQPTHRDTELSNTTDGDAHRSSKCAAGFLQLMRFTVAAAESTCCPSGDERCSGCVSWLPTGDAAGSCVGCQGGFVQRKGKCVSCVDTTGWTNAEGKTCSQLSRLTGTAAAAACTDDRVMGLSSNQVCCFCGGGTLLGTTFKYPEAMQEVGGSISVAPEPRTASHYSLNEGCELAKHGLTMDGATGVVSGTPTTTEPFEVECEVTAHQGGGASATATVAVKTGQLIYESSVLVFEGTATYTPRVQSSLALVKYQVKCVPEIPWIKVDAGSGELRREANLGSASGMLTEVGDFASGQPGGICRITATSGATSYSTSVLAVAPRPWGTFQYGTGTASSVIGDIFPVMSPQETTNAVEHALKPDYFTAACETTYPSSAKLFKFEFATQLSTGMLEGHTLFELREDGSLSFAPSSTLSAIFDGADMSVDFHTAQKAIQLQCRVYGYFAEPLLAPLSTKLNLEIKDSTCFILEEFKGTQISVPNPSNLMVTLTSCRMACRGNPSCSHFHFKDGGCYQYTRDNSAAVAATTGTTYQALAKVTDCNENNMCLEVDLDHHAVYLTGTYCPQGYDVLRGVVYQKTGSTPQENLWLVRLTSHDPTPTGITCEYLDGYVVRQVESEVDLVNKEAGSFELRGTPRACLRKELVSSAFGNVEVDLPTRYSQPAHDSGVAGLLQEIPPTPAVFVTRAEGTAGCLPGQEVQTKAQCVAAAGELGYSESISAGVWMWGVPAGCSVSPGGTDLKFNTFAEGAGAVGRVPICLADVATLQASTCGPPVEEFAEGLDSVSSIMIDLPSTVEELDYWTHPCDCAPPQWGAHPPVDASLHTQIPPESNNIFIPPPFDIVEGEYACDIKYILSVHPESTEGVSMDQSACQSLCSDNPLCGFYWSGTQRGLTSCRLYSACDNLVREFLSNGKLVAVPRKEMCQVSDPEACWKTTLRREFLTNIKTTTCASHTCAAGSSPRPDAENTVCGHLHQADSPNCTDERCCIEDHFRLQTSGCSNPSECIKGECVAVSERINLTKDVTCCSDVPRRNWVNECGNVWAKSPHCGTQMNFFEAQTYCHALGARLCSYNELKANCARGSGCDGRIVWTSESCASTVKGGLCPALYPQCQADGDCAVDGCRSGDCVWAHAPHGSTHPTQGLWFDSTNPQRPYVYTRATDIFMGDKAYTYIDGYDAAGTLCSGDYQDSMALDMFIVQDGVGRFDAGVEYQHQGPSWHGVTCSACAIACLHRADCLAFSSYVDTCSAESTDTGQCWFTVGRPNYWKPDSYWLWRAEKNPSAKKTTGKLYIMKGRGVAMGTGELPHICTYNDINNSPKSCGVKESLTLKHQSGYPGYSPEPGSGSMLFLASLDQMPVDTPSANSSREGRIFPVPDGYGVNAAGNGLATAKCPDGKVIHTLPSGSDPWYICCDAKPVSSSDTTCTTPTVSCSCPNGNPPPPGDALCKGGHHCVSCNPGFELNSADNLCSVRQCTCDNGQAASGTFCPTHGASLCLACTLGYTLESGACTKDPVFGGYPEYVAPAFHYLNLHRQCDQEQLLGGSGAVHCSRPTYADPNSHAWKHKRRPPTVFKHGEVLNVSCWAERYSGMSGSAARSYAEIQCVHGDWFDRLTGASGLTGFQCERCVQVAEPGYTAYHDQRNQELMWTNRLVNRLYSDGAIRNCIHGSGAGSATEFGPTVTCDRFLFQSTKYSADESKLLQFAEGTGSSHLCLSGSPSGFTKETCNGTSSEQLTKTSDVGKILWHMHGKVSNVSVVTKNGTGHDIRSLEGEGTCMPQGAFGMLNLGAEISTCHFAPVLQDTEWRLARYGNIAGMLECHECDGGIGLDAARENQREHKENLSVAWRHQLAGAEVKCNEGEALVAVRFRNDGLHFKCAFLAGLGECRPSFTTQFDVEPKGIGVLAEMNISCPGHDVIESFHFEHSEMGKWARWRYSCCEAGGVPTVIEPVRLDKALSKDFEGLYCPVKLDDSGRHEYQSRGLVGKTIPHKKLVHDNMNGQWCLAHNSMNGQWWSDPSAGDCQDSMSVEPIGVKSQLWEAVEVTDFDSSPKESHHEHQLDEVQRYKLKEAPTLTKKDWRPEYSSECKFDQFDDFDRPFVWDKVSDKYGDENLQYFDQYHGNMPDGHPCKVADLSVHSGNSLRGFYGIEDKIGGSFPDGGDGDFWKELAEADEISMGTLGFKKHTGLTYESIFKCRLRQELREWAGRVTREHWSLLGELTDFASASSDLLCGLIPDGVIAPFGTGVKVQPADLCKDAKDIAVAGVKLKLFNDKARGGRARQFKEFTDCDPLQEGLARLFCDIHCVRDAVVRGEKNLRRVLSKATEITNANLKAFANWNAESLNTQALHVDTKITWLQAYLGQRLDSGNLQLDKVSESLTKMLSELQGLASQSRFEAPARASAFGALKAFVGSTEVASPEPGAENYTQYVQVLEQVANLHATLKAGSQRSQAASASMLLSEGVRMQLGNVRSQMRKLGQFREHGEKSKSRVREWSSTRAAGSMLLVQMDKVWWHTRNLLDEFLEQSEAHLTAFRDAFDALASYRECSSGFSQLLGVYNRAMAVRERTHKKLRQTWRKSSNSLGELASIVVDGEVFANSMAEEGCSSKLAERTLVQMDSAAHAVLFLIHHYEEAGLELPSVEVPVDALSRVRNNFQEAQNACLASTSSGLEAQ